MIAERRRRSGLCAAGTLVWRAGMVCPGLQMPGIQESLICAAQKSRLEDIQGWAEVVITSVSRPFRRVPVRLRLPVFVFVVCQLVLLLWWAAYYPGAMSYDSISYVWHVTTDHWMANHSVP